MELTFRKRGTDMIFRPLGTIQQADLAKLRDAVAKVYELSSEMASLKVELTGAAHIPDDTLGILAEWYSECRRDGVPLRFVHVPRASRERFMERGIFDVDFDDERGANEVPIVV
jgi:hypothetical protein